MCVWCGCRNMLDSPQEASTTECRGQPTGWCMSLSSGELVKRKAPQGQLSILSVVSKSMERRRAVRGCAVNATTRDPRSSISLGTFEVLKEKFTKRQVDCAAYQTSTKQHSTYRTACSISGTAAAPCGAATYSLQATTLLPINDRAGCWLLLCSNMYRFYPNTTSRWR